MRNHWHFVLWPAAEGQVQVFLHLLTTTHAVRRRRATGTVGHGHIYQDRYRASGIWSETYYLNVIRYVEQNPLRAALVSSASHERLQHRHDILDEGPYPLPADWHAIVEDCLPQHIVDEIRRSLQRH